MPIPISRLFLNEDYQIHGVPRYKDIIDMSKDWPSIDIKISDIPHVNYPQGIETSMKQDVELVKSCYHNPMCDDEFLETSNEKPFELFKSYVLNNDLDYDIGMLDQINEDLSALVLNLKYKYNRPRPKKHMRTNNIVFPYEDIKESGTPSYPSGHAAHAFFNAAMISKSHPEHEMRLRNLAEMIGQSRVDLAVHFPSDVSFGKFIGEMCASRCLGFTPEKKLMEGNMSREDVRDSREKFRLAAKKHNQSEHGTRYVDELCEFIIRSNQIERYDVDHSEAEQACESFLNGLPVKYCTENKYIRSHLDALDAASHCDTIDSPDKVQYVHKAMGQDVLERGFSGMFRDFHHCARSTGYQYTAPKNIPSVVLDWCNAPNSDKFKRHIMYECIHPFSDGNGRSGRIILCCDMLFDFAAVNDMIGSDYIPKIVAYQ